MLGATNRINDIDEAILRRMPKKPSFPLPGTRSSGRRILQLVGWATPKRTRSGSTSTTWPRVTAGLSGSDIKEACRDAAIDPDGESTSASTGRQGRPWRLVEPVRACGGPRTEDFFRAQGRRGAGTLLAPPTRGQGRRPRGRGGLEVAEAAATRPVDLGGSSWDGRECVGGGGGGGIRDRDDDQDWAVYGIADLEWQNDGLLISYGTAFSQMGGKRSPKTSGWIFS